MGVSYTTFHQRYVGGRAVFAGDTEQSGAGAATTFLPPLLCPSPATALVSMSGLGVVGTGNSGPYVPAFSGVLTGGIEGVAVDEREKWCQASCSVPGAADMTAVDAVDMLDSGSGITNMSVGIANKLQTSFSDLQVVGGMSHGRVLAVEKKRARCGSRCTPARVWSPWIPVLWQQFRETTMLSFSATRS